MSGLQVTEAEMFEMLGRLYVENLALRRDLELTRQQAAQAQQGAPGGSDKPVEADR